MKYKHATIYLTMSCNMGCPLCHQYGTALKQARWTASKSDIVSAAAALRGLHIKTVTLSGGEPLLYANLDFACKTVRDTCDTIQVITNGVGNSEQLGRADIIRVTDYGAANRYFIHKLRKRYGRKVHVSPAVHVPCTVVPYSERVSCNLLHAGIANGKIYACCTQALHDIKGIPVTGDVKAYLDNADPTAEDICHTCIGNKFAYQQIAVPPTLQSAIWGVEEACLVQTLQYKPVWLYKLYSRFRAWRGR